MYKDMVVMGQRTCDLSGRPCRRASIIIFLASVHVSIIVNTSIVLVSVTARQQHRTEELRLFIKSSPLSLRQRRNGAKVIGIC